jgi:hypothetical protein
VALKTDNLLLRCRCGRMGGVASDVSPSTGFRFIGYCKDCQAFARFLERADVVDPAGGTDIFQMPPGRVKITAGTHAVRCPRLFNASSASLTGKRSRAAVLAVGVRQHSVYQRKTVGRRTNIIRE